MLAYHNDYAVKAKYLGRVATHREMDELVKGQYWSDGRGCAVGCTIHGDDHMAYEAELGIPVAIARLEDYIFEGLPIETAKLWPERFLSAINPGTDLSCVTWKFLHWLLTTPEVNPGITDPLVADAVRQCALVLEPLTRGEPVDEAAAALAAKSVDAAVRSARSAAAAWSVGAGWTALSAKSAALSVDAAARSAAKSAAKLAAEAAEAAALAKSARSVRSVEAAGLSSYTLMANKLIELLEAC